jgi:hypothetical protein
VNYYDRNGAPMGFHEWLQAFDDIDSRRVAFHQISEDCSVSTVWLGLDHGFGLARVPLIFETMTFGGAHDGDCVRTATEAAARAAHDQAVAAARAS